MTLVPRARVVHAVLLILCVLLLAAMALPAAAKDKERDDRGSSRPAAAEEDSAKAPRGKAKGHDRDDRDDAEASAAPSQQRADNPPRGKAKGQSGGTATAGSDDGQEEGQAKTKGRGRAASETKGSGGSDSSPAGNKGSMKVRPVGTAAHPPRNYAHLPCTVQVDFYGSPHAGAALTARSHAPTSPTGQTLLTATMTFESSSPNPRGNELVGSTTLDFSDAVDGLSHHPQQGYHVKLTAQQDGPQGGDVKHKVFWIDCAAPEEADVGGALEEETVTGDIDLGQGADAEASETEVLGITIEGEVEVEAGESRVLGRAAAADAAGGDGRFLGAAGGLPGSLAAVGGALAATGVPALALALLALAGLGVGTHMVRRTRMR